MTIACEIFHCVQTILSEDLKTIFVCKVWFVVLPGCSGSICASLLAVAGSVEVAVVLTSHEKV